MNWFGKQRSELQHEARFDNNLCELELLFDIFDDGTAVETHECPADEFGMNGMCPHDLSSDPQ